MKIIKSLLVLVPLLSVVMLAGLSCGRKDDTFRIDLVTYIPNSYTKSFEESLREGLDAAGLVDGRDFKLRIRSAQGDMTTLTSLVDAAENDRANLLILFQAQTLYAALDRARSVNKMFTLLQDPFVLGAGQSDADHLPRLTGMYLVPPFAELIGMIAECRPSIYLLGTIYDPGNADSVSKKDELIQIAATHQMQVKAVPYTSANEIMTATEALMAERPQGIIHLQDPAQDMTFPALFKTASRARIPVFSVVYNMEKIGAAIACSTDRREIGLKFAAMVVRVIRGEDPSVIPFENDRDLKKRIGYNQTVATDIKLTLPPSVVKQ